VTRPGAWEIPKRGIHQPNWVKKGDEKLPIYMGGFPKKLGGGPPKWMVKIMENHLKMDDLGVPLFFGKMHIGINITN